MKKVAYISKNSVLCKRGVFMREKNKYQRMTKEEKKQCQKFYYNTEKGQAMRSRLNRLVIIGVVGLLFSIFLLISGYLSHELSWATILLAVILTIFSLVYIVSSITLRRKCLNNYAIKYMK